MSSQSAARLARATMFALEALEPRRFLSAGDPGEPIAIDSAGTRIAGSFEGGVLVRLEFTAETGAHYVFFQRHANAIQMSVLSDDGETQLAAAGATGYKIQAFINRLDWVAPQSGVYLLQLSQTTDHGALYENYQLNVRVAQDQVGDVPEQAVPIEDHGDVNGFIDSIEDSDWYSFDVQAGHLYHLKSGNFSGDGWRGLVRFSVYGSDGATEIQSQEDWDFVFRAGETGKYYLRAWTDAQWPDDDYRLRVDSLVEPGYSSETALDWNLSDTIYGYHLEQENWWGRGDAFLRFEAQAGEMYIFNSGTSKEIDVRAGDGKTVLASGSYVETGQRLIWVAPASGSYFLTVGYYNGFLVEDTGGPYVISAKVILPEAVPNAVGISPQETINGELSQPGQIDLFKFETKENAIYTFTMPFDPELYCCLWPQGPEIPFLIQLMGEADSPAYAGDNNWWDVGGGHFLREAAQWQAASAGTHYLSVSSTNWAASGSYQITMTETLDDFGNNDEHASPIVLDTPVNGRIDYEEDSDYFAFNVIAGQTYAVEVSSDTIGDSQGRGAGVDLQNWPDSVGEIDEYAPGRSRVTFTAATSRVYFFRVGGGVDQRYTIAVHEAILPEPGDEVGTLAPDQPQELRVQPGQTVFLCLLPQQGSRYEVRVNESQNLAWYLADSSGAIFEDGRYYVSLDYSEESARQLPAPLYVAIKGVEGLPATSVSVMLKTYRPHSQPPPTLPEPPPSDDEEPAEDPDVPAANPQPPATPSLIQTISGSIKKGASDLFSFHAIAGRSYRFRTVLGTLDDSILGLFDPLTQKVIAVNDDTEDEAVGEDDPQLYSSEIVWTADRTGDVYLIVYGYDEESTGSYRLEVYSTSAAMTEETLAAVSLAAARADEMVAAVDDALWADEDDSSSDDSDVWADSQDSWDDSGDWLDSDVWEEDEI